MNKDSVVKLAAEFIAPFEGEHTHAYKDIAGVWTIGIGATGPGIEKGIVWTHEQVLARFAKDLEERYAQLDTILGAVPTTDSQGAAMLSLLFNIGSGNFKTSTVAKEHKTKHYDRAANAFLLWNKAGGMIVGGLVRRRKAERELYLSEA